MGISLGKQMKIMEFSKIGYPWIPQNSMFSRFHHFQPHIPRLQWQVRAKAQVEKLQKMFANPTVFVPEGYYFSQGIVVGGWPPMVIDFHEKMMV